MDSVFLLLNENDFHLQFHLSRETTMKSVVELQPGEQATVARVGGKGAIRQRLLDMGILPQAQIRVQRIALSGDPVWIEFGGMQLALRRKEAQAVLLG